MDALSLRLSDFQPLENLSFDNSAHIYALYKPVGMTSFDLIRGIRGKLLSVLGKGKGRRKLKIGHFGTLDPFADGLMLVGTGKAMKLMNTIQNELPKTYMALGKIGEKTYTGDCDGEVFERLEVDDYTIVYESIRKQVSELGDAKEYWQRPPYYSAVKHEGKPLYEYAREGVFIEKPPVCREIYQLEVLDCPHEQGEHFVSFRSQVSNGTYIRTLWQDLLKEHKECGHLTALTRESIGPISLSSAVKIDEFKEADTLKEVDVTEILPYPKLFFGVEDSVKLFQGQPLYSKVEGQGPFWCFYKDAEDGHEQILGLAMAQGNSMIKIETQLYTPPRNTSR